MEKGGKSIDKISLMSEGFCVQTQGTGREDRALSYLSGHVFFCHHCLFLDRLPWSFLMRLVSPVFWHVTLQLSMLSKLPYDHGLIAET